MSTTKRLRPGDFVILKGKGYYEKVDIVSVKKGIATTSVGVKFDRKTLIPINSVFEVLRFDEKLYEEVEAIYRTKGMLKTMIRFVEDNNDDLDLMLKIFKGIKRINKKIYS